GVDVLDLGVRAIGVVAQELAVPVGDTDAAVQVGTPERVEAGLGMVARLDLGEAVEVDRRDELVHKVDIAHEASFLAGWLRRIVPRPGGTGTPGQAQASSTLSSRRVRPSRTTAESR